MASSEIEVVSSDSNAEKNPEAEAVTQAVIDVFSACAYGDFEKLRKFVEEDGAASLSQPDLNGYYALQWASLNNFPHIVQYIVEVFFLLLLISPINSDFSLLCIFMCVCFL